jgi:hypothetical protein
MAKSQPTTQLAVSTQEPAEASRAHVLFAKRRKQVTMLRDKIGKKQLLLDDLLERYHKEVLPLKERLGTFRLELAQDLYRRSQDAKQLTKKQRSVLLTVVQEQLTSACNETQAPSDALKKLFHEVHGVSIEDYNKEIDDQGFADMKENLSTEFRRMGLEINLDDIKPDAGSPQEIMNTIMERFEAQAREHFPADQVAPKNKKVTKQQASKQAQLDAAKAVSAQTVATLYKRLALVLHPDLEQDAQRKLHKEELMKELTVAKEKGDLHTMLRLEAEWLAGVEGDAAGKAADAKLAIYNQVLKAQIDELEIELKSLQMHPRYFSLLFEFGDHLDLSKLNMKPYLSSLQELIFALSQSIHALHGPNARQEILQIVEEFSSPF